MTKGRKVCPHPPTLRYLYFVWFISVPYTCGFSVFQSDFIHYCYYIILFFVCADVSNGKLWSRSIFKGYKTLKKLRFRNRYKQEYLRLLTNMEGHINNKRKARIGITEKLLNLIESCILIQKSEKTKFEVEDASINTHIWS